MSWPYRSAAGVWTFLGNSGGYGASATWRRMVWDTPPIPADATGVTVGATLSSPGLLTIDDVMMIRL